MSFELTIDTKAKTATIYYNCTFDMTEALNTHPKDDTKFLASEETIKTYAHTKCGQCWQKEYTAATPSNTVDKLQEERDVAIKRLSEEYEEKIALAAAAVIKL